MLPNRPKINQNFDQFSLSILDGFGVVLGPQLGVIFDQISLLLHVPANIQNFDADLRKS